MKPKIPSIELVLPYLSRMQSSGRYSNFGPLEQELRNRAAAFLDVAPDQVASAANATLALTGAFAVSGCKDWRVPSFTFAATAAAVAAAGHRGRFCDIGDDWWMRCVASRDSGLVPVAPFGSPLNLADWPHRNSVVIDMAASLGEQPNLSRLPSGWATVFSVHATKVLGAGEGGLAVFGDPSQADEFRRWTNFGFDGHRSSLSMGVNAKMSEMQAAYALAALDGWAEERREWLAAREGACAVEAGFDGGFFRSRSAPQGVNPYWIVEFESGRTAQLALDVFEERSIETRRWWGSGCHRMPAFSAWEREPLAATERAAATYLGLPFYRGIGEAELERVGDALAVVESRR